MSVPNVEKRVNVEIETIEKIPALKVIKPKVFPDDRGFFSETYNITEWAEKLDYKEVFMQDNHSYSKYGVLRGLHTQPGMGKLVSVATGKIFDVAVDRINTPFWIPSGFLHGFQCLSPEGAHVTYKCTAVYDPKTEFGINPFDKEIDVQWPITDQDKIIVSERDTQHNDLSSLPR
ncbi:unnamed protein product, partial [Mesorhabditis belari]|uniref:dTDP-4-dehydrorhamnose 3,5-epimerase n=1 Tax=Mesorhabditis belari TaxID=2138241 RepID=A0AAF3JB39_9BILA